MGANDRNQFDDLLHSALKRYSEVEPRMGLEGRLLARLAATPRQSRNRWVWAMAAVSALCIIAVAWFGVPLVKESHQEVAPTTSMVLSPTRAPQASITQAASAQVSLSRRARPLAKVAREPALQQFPSPRPMSEQELLLVEYVEHYPKEATLIAKEQAEFQNRVEQAQNEAAEELISDR
jgi:hypothetical protein